MWERSFELTSCVDAQTRCQIKLLIDLSFQHNAFALAQESAICNQTDLHCCFQSCLDSCETVGTLDTENAQSHEHVLVISFGASLLLSTIIFFSCVAKKLAGRRHSLPRGVSPRVAATTRCLKRGKQSLMLCGVPLLSCSPPVSFPHHRFPVFAASSAKDRRSKLCRVCTQASFPSLFFLC